MTHDELLSKLWILPVDTTELQHGAKAVQALRAVVELHKPSKGSDELPPCLQCGQMYPCPTIQTIEKELK